MRNNRKKTVILALFFLSFFTVSAQKASLNRAYNFFFEKDFVKAKNAIDLCTADEKLKTKANTWLYKGNIYFYLANSEYAEKQKDSEFTITFPDAPVDAYDAFVKALEIDKNVEAYDMMSPGDALPKLYTLLLIRGVDLLIANDFDNAVKVLERAVKSYEMKTPEHPLEGELYYYYAYALETLNNPAKAREYYEKAIKDNSKNANVYVRLIEGYKKENNKAKILEIITSGKKALPNDPNLLVMEIDYYYWTEDTEKGKALLANLPASAYSNPDALVNISNFHLKDSNYTEAERLLKRAYELNPNSFVVVFNLGVCSYIISEKESLAANQLEVDGKREEAAVLKNKSNNYLNQAETYFEKALTFEPDDLNVLNTLKAIYARKVSPKYDEIVKKINELNK